MAYLLDTHIVLWWLDEPKKIIKPVRDIIENRSNKIFLSAVSVWEMAIKKDIGKLNIPMNFLSVLKQQNFEILPLHADESIAVVDLPKLHNDPFDRLLIAQAQVNSLILITKDPYILKYPINTLNAS